MSAKQTVARFELDVSAGFDAGGYASAYETSDLSEALAKLSMNRSDSYVDAFVLGFMSNYGRHEMSEAYRDAYDAALASRAGVRCIELGYIER